MPKIKICGIRRLEDVEIINKYKPEYIGFVFADSKRQIDYKTAKTLKKHLNRDILVVGVFVDGEISEIIHLYEKNIIDIAQLHGSETKEYISQLKSRCSNLKIIKAIEVNDSKDLDVDFDVDYLLLDSGKGSGKTFNWDLINKNINKDFFLAGGLNSTNLKKAINTFHPYAVDLSSGVEVNGFKDDQKIKEIMELNNGEM